MNLENVLFLLSQTENLDSTIVLTEDPKIRGTFTSLESFCYSVVLNLVDQGCTISQSHE